MGELNVLVDRLLYKILVLLAPGFGDYVPYELSDAGVDMLLVVARHGRILAEWNAQTRQWRRVTLRLVV